MRTDARALKRARARAEQAERDARRMRDQRRRWEEDGTRLTRAEFEAGVPCRGCGEPWLDGLGGWPPLLDMTPEQRADYDREVSASSNLASPSRKAYSAASVWLA